MRRIQKSLTALSILIGVLLFSSGYGPASADGKQTAASPDKTAVEKIVHDYLLKHPEIVIEAIEAYKANAKEREAAEVRREIAARRDEIYNDPESAVGGNSEGDVTLVEFFDYRCGVCKQTHPIVEELVKRDGKIRVVYKEWPILGPESVFASRAAIASRLQNARKYVAFHNALMKTRRVTRDSVLAIAAQVGLDAKRLERDMASSDTDSVIKRNYALAEALKLNGTPSFIIGKTLLRGGRDLDTLQAIVKDERKKSQL